MAKRFKFKFSRVISFRSCRSKDPFSLTLNPVPSFLRFPVNHNSIIINNPAPSQPPSSKPRQHSSIKRHVSSVFTSMGCGHRSESSARYLSETDRAKSSQPTGNFHREKGGEYDAVAKLLDDDSSPRRKISTTLRSTSSADSGLFFSGDENVINVEETETLVSSSRSFSTDSPSEFNPHFETIREYPFKRAKRGRKAKGGVSKKGTRRRGRKARNSSDGSLSPARLSMFQWLVPCTVEGKVRGSFAVVKKSDDPYEDFKRSMMEMILEKEMFEEKDVEQLLHCFLSLNLREHHGGYFFRLFVRFGITCFVEEEDRSLPGFQLFNLFVVLSLELS
ncbi:hypothetical protein OIU74_020363 [Salix koriyanagi]|uniref:Transcription repressor n=1 Tax=Salix koriyanagi TaxID=2511006 RepID=A0A9Q0SMB6_9ROSI|nr:hypothetical protein OIU74_020363 [Salix koriyanagi]